MTDFALVHRFIIRSFIVVTDADEQADILLATVMKVTCENLKYLIADIDTSNYTKSRSNQWM